MKSFDLENVMSKNIWNGFTVVTDATIVDGVKFSGFEKSYDHTYSYDDYLIPDWVLAM